MNARLRATLLAAVLFVAFVGVLIAQPTGYMRLSPGPTTDVLAANLTMKNNPSYIQIKGHKSYPDTDGQLRMLTVYEMGPGQTLSLASAIGNWLRDDTSVYPEEFWHPAGTTQEQSNQQGAAQMASSQDLARAAGLRAAGFKVPEHQQIELVDVDSQGPARGIIKSGDVVVSVDGKPMASSDAFVKEIGRYHPGDKISMVVKRAGKKVPVTITAGAKGTSGAAAQQARIGVSVGQAQKFDFPFTIKFNLDANIEGSSAGMMFSLAIYDLLTPGSLTDGHVVAGTGTIGSDPKDINKVGPIGGIAQKIKGAQNAGAELFLAPAANCDEVVRAHYDHDSMRIVKVATLQDALKAITTWTADPHAALPGCSS